MSPESVESVSLRSGQVDFRPPLIKYTGFEFGRERQPASLLGTNASGKSTLALALAGAVPAAYWADVQLDLRVRTSHQELSYPEISRIVGVIPQRWEHGSLGYGPADELKLAGVGQGSWPQYVTDRLNLPALEHCEPAHLSSGERKRLLVAIGLARKQRLVVSDEWPAHLDNHWLGVCDELIRTYIEDQGGFHLELVSSEIGGGVVREYRPFSGIVVGDEGTGPRAPFADTLCKLLPATLEARAPALSWEPWIDGSFRFSPRHNRRVAMSAQGGELIEIVGDNGVGKSTLLRMVWRSSAGARAMKRLLGRSSRIRGQVHLVEADPIYQILGPTVADELKRLGVPPVTSGSFGEDVKAHLARDILSISTGERKILALMLAALGASQIIALDEPFSGLDENAHELGETMIRLALRRKKVVLVACQRAFNPNATQRIELN